MQAFFQYHSKLHPFRLFSVEHLIIIGIIFVLCIFLFIFKNKLKEIGKSIGLILSILLIISEGMQQLWLLYEHAWTWKRALPIQLSDLAVILAIIMLLTRSYKLFQFLYFTGLGSSIQALLTPDLGKYSFPHFQYFEFFVSHGGVVFACLFMVMVFCYRPTIPSMWVTILIVNLYSGLIFFLNKWWGTNFLYMMQKPRVPSLLNYLGPWPWYLISLELVMILSFYILYIPFWIKKEKYTLK